MRALLCVALFEQTACFTQLACLLNFLSFARALACFRLVRFVFLGSLIASLGSLSALRLVVGRCALLCLICFAWLACSRSSLRFHEPNMTWIGIKLLLLDFGKIPNFGSKLPTISDTLIF